MLRVSGAFATKFMEELRLARLTAHFHDEDGELVEVCAPDLGTSPGEHRAIEKFLENMKYKLAEVLFPEVAHGENSGRAQAPEAVPPQAGH